ncbi:unnamed protein product [Amoebophrya sp. A120]|nr:unnamed protein product [Amoebophrya sp. A120]|eukprot:GSA120T00011626001.1
MSSCMEGIVGSPLHGPGAIPPRARSPIGTTAAVLMADSSRCSVTKDLVQNLYTLNREASAQQDAITQQTFQHLYAQNRALQQMLEDRSAEWKKMLDEATLQWNRELLEATKQWEERVNRVTDNVTNQFQQLQTMIAKRDQATQDEFAQLRAHMVNEHASLQTLHDRADKTMHEQNLRLAALEQEIEEAARTKALEQTVNGLAKDLRDMNTKVAGSESTTNQNMNRMMQNVQNVHETLLQEINGSRSEMLERHSNLEDQVGSHAKKHEYSFAALQKELRSGHEFVQKDLEKSKDEFGAKLHTSHMALDKQILGCVKDFDLRLTRVLEEVKSCELRTKEGFSNASADVAQVRTTILQKVHEEETTRDHLLAQVRDAIDYTNKGFEQRTDELGKKLDAEQRARNQECSALGMTMGDVQTKVDEAFHELSSFRHQANLEFIKEKQLADSVNEVTQKVLVEANRRNAENEQLTAALYDVKAGMAEIDKHSTSRTQDLEKIVGQQKGDLMARFDEVWNELQVQQLTNQKIEGTVAQHNVERVKDNDKRKVEISDLRDWCEKTTQAISGEMERRVQQGCDLLSSEQQRAEDSQTDKNRRVAEDIRRLQSGLSSEANVRMLDVENVFARMQMLKEEIMAQVDSEKRQRILGEEKLSTDQTQVRRLLQTNSPTQNVGSRLFDRSGPGNMVSPIRGTADPTFLFGDGNSSWLSGAGSPPR